MTAERIGRRAVVIGGSLAGLFHARVLADHFEEVIIVERDASPGSPEHRKGVPQDAHAHGLLAAGLQSIEALFPDLVRAAVAGGALCEEFGTTTAWHHFGGWKQRAPYGIRAMLQSRPFLEFHVRERVRALPNLRWIDQRKVVGYLPSSGGGVRGVQLAQPDEDLAADLVIDASGRGSRTADVLAALGGAPPPISEIRVGVGYATRIFRRTIETDWKALLVTPAPPDKRMGVLFAIEGGRWICTLGGWLGDHAPTDDAGWLEFARSLPVPHVHDILAREQPLGPIGVHKFPASVRRHYERTRMPDRLLVVGDAVCSFNPVYGQGMTVAALEAIELGRQLRAARTLDGVTARAQKAFAAIIDIPWTVAGGEDFRWPETGGKRAPATALINAYVGRVHRVAQTDPEVAHAFFRVMHLLATPQSLFRPATLLRVLFPRDRAPQAAPPLSSPRLALVANG